MDEHVTGRQPGEAAAPEEPGLAERLMNDEFADAAPSRRTRLHRDAKSARRDASLAADGGRGVAFEETAQIPVVGTPASTRIHEVFAEPARPPRSRSHRAGMLAGLGVVGVLLAALVLLAPGSGKPRLPAQSVHDVSPISASGPKTAAATAPPPPAASSTTSSAVGPSTTTPQPQPHQTVTAPSTVTYVYLPGSTTPDTTPATTAGAATTTPTTAPPPPPAPTTTTTSPPTTTSTTVQCFLGVICN